MLVAVKVVMEFPDGKAEFGEEEIIRMCKKEGVDEKELRLTPDEFHGLFKSGLENAFPAAKIIMLEVKARNEGEG